MPGVCVARLLHDLGHSISARGRHNILQWVHDFHRQVAHERYLPTKAALQEHREVVIKMFRERMAQGIVSARTARELPWLYMQCGDRAGLGECLNDVQLFTLLRDAMDRGVFDLSTYWNHLKESPITRAETMSRQLQSRYNDLRELGIDKHTSELKRLIRACSQTGAFLRDAGYYDQAISPCQLALDISTAILGAQSPQTAQRYADLGSIYCDLKMFDLALHYVDQAVKTIVDAQGEEAPILSSLFIQMGTIHREKGDSEKALLHYNDALKLHAKDLASRRRTSVALIDVNNVTLDYHPDTARALFNMAVLYEKRKKYRDALQYYDACLEAQIGNLGKEHPDTAYTYFRIGSIFQLKEDYGTAGENLTMALDLFEATVGVNHKLFAQTAYSLGQCYEASGHARSAKKCFKMAQDGFAAASAEAGMDKAATHKLTSTQLLADDDDDEARGKKCVIM